MRSGTGSDHAAGTEYDPAAEGPVSPGSPETPDDAPTLPVASVARRLGVAPSTLRTWDRRYGLGPSRHTDGRHRRYGAADVHRLELMQRALLRGCSTAEAARYALEQLPKAGQPPVVPGERAEISGLPHRTALRIEAPIEPGPGTQRPEPTPPAASRLARRLSGAALAMDGAAVQRMLAEIIEAEGVLAAWQDVLAPVLAAVGARWRGSAAGAAGAAGATGSGAEVEYLLAECVFAALVRATPVLAAPRNQRPVLLGCAPEERDGMPLYALAASLAGRGLGTQLFGVPLPADVLAVAVRRTAPAVVLLWANRSVAADPHLFVRLSRGRQRGRLFACGPGWTGVRLPDWVELLPDLAEAADRVEHVLVGRRGQAGRGD